MLGFVGSYTKEEGKGLYKFELENGDITAVEVAAESDNATYFAIYENYLYAVARGEESGIRTFKVKEDGNLEWVKDAFEEGDSGCYVMVTSDGKYVLDAVYGSGEVRLYERADNVVTKRLDSFQIEGSGPHERQDAPHAHSVDETPDKKYVIACDLGADKVVTLKIEDDALKLVHETHLKPGSGPRHLRFSGCGKYCYVFTELSNELLVYDYNDGKLDLRHTYSTLPEDFDGHSQGAAIRRHHEFLYVSNRGHNSIAVFKIVDGGSDVELLEIVSTHGDWPRDFNISPDGKYLVCAHERSHHLSLFEVQDGKLKFINNDKVAHEGVCVEFLNA